MINLPLRIRVLTGIGGLAVCVAVILGYPGVQPVETITFMVGSTLLTISQLADLRPDAGNGLLARMFRRSTQFLVAIVVFGWTFIAAGLVYVYVRHGTIWLES